ncbi:hypothetical protein [Pseudomonas putida]|uniref:hypothetical protein n=1 Tax=Pseudomonas putida TaxID=303 RepID=UPI003CFD98B2
MSWEQSTGMSPYFYRASAAVLYESWLYGALRQKDFSIVGCYTPLSLQSSGLKLTVNWNPERQIVCAG